MPRLFFGLALPGSVMDALDRIAEGVPAARWVPEENYHITLAFLGDVPERYFPMLDEAARVVRTEPFLLSFHSVGVFPKRPPARVLWAGLEPEPLLHRLQKRLERELAEIGFVPEKRKFHAHVTLARLSQEAPRDAVSDWVGHHLGFSSPPFPVARFQLFESVQTTGGHEYQVRATYPLRR